MLAEILAAPDDRAPRLVYADRLIEAGDPRGTFIAQQCLLLDIDPLDDRYAPMLASTRRLEAAHGRSWIADHVERTGMYPIEVFGPRFDGGFLQRIAMRAEHIAPEWPRLRSREPIRGIELLVSEGLDARYRGLHEPRDFEVLKVTPSDWFTASSVANVLAWGMPRLRSLDLSACDLGVAGAQLLANQPTDLGEYFADHVAPPPFPHGQLTELLLDSCQISDEGACAIFEAAHLERLATLDLARCRIADPKTLEVLRDAPAMRQLRRLSLVGNNALGEHMGRLAGWPVLAELTALSLPQTTTAAAVKELLPRASPVLRELTLASAKQLGASPVLLELAEALVELDVGTTSLGDERWAALVEAPCARRLVRLKANGGSLSDAAVEALVGSPLDRLVVLDLSSNKLTDRGLAALAGWPGLQHVAHLRIGNNRKLTAAGFKRLAGAAQFQPAVLDIGKPSDATLVASLRERFGDAVVAR